MSQDALVKEKKSIYIVWIIPLVAMVLAGWMIFKHYDNKGYEIVVTFNHGNGLVVGKTALIYNGIQIGKVTDMNIQPHDVTKIDVTITVDKQIKGAAKAGNIYWMVEPKLSLTEVSGLSTILGGVYISVMPSSKVPEEIRAQPSKFNFIAQDEAPINIFSPGKSFTLHAEKSDIKVGAPIMYRKINIGQVLDVKLTDKGVDYLVHITSKYAHLVKVNSKFWKISGVEVRASLAGIRVEMDSLASVIAGGISLNSPSNGQDAKANQTEYTLFATHKEVLRNQDVITLVAKDGYNIDPKSAFVFFKGVRAGAVVDLAYEPSTDSTTIKIKLNKTFRHLANESAYFWIVEPHFGLTEIKGLDSIAKGPYIAFETKTKSKTLKTKFKLHEESPLTKGIHITLLADRGYNLKNGVNVLFKDVVIGSVRDISIDKKKKKIAFGVVVDNKYKHLVNDSSVFYIEGAMEMDASFDGLYFNVGSISSMMHGGIALATENAKAKLTQKNFALLKNYKAYEESKYREEGGKQFVLKTKNLGSLKEGSIVSFKGINVGKVVKYKLNKTSGEIEIDVYVKPMYVDQINASTSFYNISGIQVKMGLDGVKVQTDSLESMVQGGIAFKTPLQLKATKERQSFELFDDEDAADEKYVEVSLSMQKEHALKVGSQIVYKSIVIGQVKTIKLINDKLVATALINHEYTYILVHDSLFWVEDVRVSINKIDNPSAILTGAFIRVVKGNGTTTTSNFEILNEEPVSSLNKKGLRIKVTGSRLSSLKKDSPVFYRQIQIGNIESFKLSTDGKGVEMKLFIDECYRYLVRENSIFYNATAMGMDVSLFGVKISTETISTMIHGGITMVTPNKPKAMAKDAQSFKLHDAPEEKWLEYSPTLVNDNASCQAQH